MLNRTQTSAAADVDVKNKTNYRSTEQHHFIFSKQNSCIDAHTADISISFPPVDPPPK